MLAAYDGLAEATVAPLAGGLLHASFALEAGGQSYVLQRVNPVFSARIHENIQRVTRHLSARGVPTPRLIETLAGHHSVDLGSPGRWRLFSRWPGVVFDVCGCPEQARSAGALVAGFHTALADFEAELHPLGFAYHDTARHLADLAAALARHASHELHSEVAALAREVFEAAESWRDRVGLPRRVIHGDLKFNNILFEGEGPAERRRASCLIDLDTLARMPLYFDLGDAWRSWCNAGADAEAELDLNIFRASAEGYLGALRLDLGSDELASLAEGLERVSLELCARFAADVLEESYFDWDRCRFESAGHHNWVRARGQMSLYRQARETREERLCFLLG